MFRKGDLKPPSSGRKKGVKNKPKPKNVYDFLLENNIEPITHILDLAKNGDMQDKDRARVWMELISYIYAKPKAEMHVELDNINAALESKTLTDVGNKIIKAIEKWNG